jgi:hypothetical protein
VDSQSVTLAKSALITSALDNLRRPEQLVEMAYDKQEWEICNIISKEDVDGIPYYWE